MVRDVLLLLCLIFLAASCSDAELDYNCTDVPLRVQYQGIKHYNGDVQCGSLLLKGDVHVPPKIWFPQASNSTYYTVVMIDPDVGHGYWPDNGTFGHWPAPIRHWVVGNVRGEELRKGNLDSGVVLWPYSSPRIDDEGSHRYGFFLFEQPGHIEYKPMRDSPVEWNYAEFLQNYSVPITKAASNYMILMYDGTPDVNTTLSAIARSSDFLIL